MNMIRKVLKDFDFLIIFSSLLCIISQSFTVESLHTE